MAEAGDDELIAGCLRGDAVSWSVFVDRFAGLVSWSIRKTVSNAPGGQEDFCREVFQEFFERLLREGELLKLRESQHVRKYLSVSAGHLALDRLKSLRRHAKKMLSVDEFLIPEPPEAPEGLSGGTEKALRAAMDGLSSVERECLGLYFVDGRTAPEIGRILGFTEEKVRGVVRRAKEKAREKLKEIGFDEGESNG